MAGTASPPRLEPQEDVAPQREAHTVWHPRPVAPVRLIESVRRRPVLTATSAVVATVAAVLIVEVAMGRSGGRSTAPEGSQDGVMGAGDGVPLTLVVLGDSTGAAVGATTVSHGFPRLVAATLARAAHRPVALRVLAVSGARVVNVRTNQVPRVGTIRPDIVLLVVGGNDVTHFTRRGAARRDLRAVIAECSHTGAIVVVAGVPAVGTTRRVAQPLRLTLRLRAHRLDRLWHDETAAAGAVRVELAAQTGPAFAADATLFSDDRFHPSDRGYALWADVLGADVVRAYQRMAQQTSPPGEHLPRREIVDGPRPEPGTLV